MTKAKAKQEETPGTGHNSELTENERKSLFFHHLRKRMEHNRRIDEAKAEKKADGKIAQADDVVLGDLDYAIKALNADDKATITERFIAEGEILSWLGLTPGFQTDLLRDRAPAIERIEKQGELAGLAAKDRESGYGPGSDEDQAWLRGYDNGQAIMRDNLEAAMTKKNAVANGDDGDEEPFPDEEPAEAAE
ncbi:hypothetical protein [Nitratireductor sp. GCM10026969]|uniref:hypothetical protein n=1 Tax=Nitratireductor sp. GCM10026969 TaxID=3252645 RepID=UPI00360E64D8